MNNSTHTDDEKFVKIINCETCGYEVNFKAKREGVAWVRLTRGLF